MSLPMNAEQIAEIRPAIREAIGGAPKTRVTLEVEGCQERWVQVVDHTVNAAYPHSDGPEKRMVEMPSTPTVIRVTSWKPGKYATFEIAAFDATELSEWIDRYFVRVLGCREGEYHVDTAFEQE